MVEVNVFAHVEVICSGCLQVGMAPCVHSGMTRKYMDLFEIDSQVRGLDGVTWAQDARG